jgi:type 1 glutamine amidotransferase
MALGRVPFSVACFWLCVGCGTADSGTALTGSSEDGASGDAGESRDQTEPGIDAAADASSAPFSVLLFSRTAAYRHDAIPAAVQALTELATTGGYIAEATEDPTQFSASNLARFQVVVFLNTTGDVLDDGQQGAFENWMNAGGSYVGVHSACDTEYDWPFYGALVGAYFKSHPAVQSADVRIEVADHPAMAGISSPWNRRDEWYDFQSNPRPNVTVLATVDESSYTGGTMGVDHPIVWATPTAGGGHAFYTAMGHGSESYSDPTFRGHLVGALRWAAGR